MFSKKKISFLYTTDLHGKIPHYEAVWKKAQELKVSTIHIGADLLPRTQPQIIKSQEKFLRAYLKAYYQRAQKAKISIFAFFGDNDLYAHKHIFNSFGTLLDSRVFKIEEYFFRAYGYVPEFKRVNKHDHAGWSLCYRQDRASVETYKGTTVPIKDIDNLFSENGTIESNFKKIPGGKLSVMSTHCPPANVGLDVCGLPGEEKNIGSIAIYDWIVAKSPLLVLCGHAHESYDRTGIWKANIGKSVVIQPGQGIDTIHMVYVEIIEGIVNAELIIVPVAKVL